MAFLQRIILWALALSLGAWGMARIFAPEEEPGPVFFSSQMETSAPKREGALPERVPGTQLRIQAMVQYEGPYWEDGSGEYVSNVAALMLHNTSESGITYAQVSLELEGQTYVFEFTYLPPDGRLLVPEKNRLPYIRGEYGGCHCDELVNGDFGLDRSGVLLTKSGMAGVILENTTSCALENVCLYYKLHIADTDVYVGGTTYRQAVGQIPAGGTLETVPEHFVWGYSAIVDIRAGEE